MNPRDPWTPALRTRWMQIRQHPIGGASLQHAFAARLAREHEWSPAMARKALLEYRRFAFLACTSTREVTPSKAVDAVWHLHLLHTQDYWLDFCPHALGTTLHHNPGGGAHDVARHREQYVRTLEAYEDFFGAAPREIWPRPTMTPIGRPRFTLRERFARAAVVIAAAISPALAWATMRPANPLDWRGPEFLSLYFTLMAVVFVGSFIMRGVLRRRMQPPLRSVGELSTAEIAYLAGGPNRVVDTAVAELHRRGALAWDASRKRFGRTRHSAPLDPIWKAVANALDAGSGLTQSIGKATRAVEPVRTGLERRGLWFPAEAAHRVSACAALPAAALAAFGLAKIGIGIYRDAPVTTLVVLTFVTGVFALLMYFARPGCTAAGTRELARQRALAAPSHTASPEQLALAVALTGTAVLAGTALASYHEVRAPSSSSDSGSSSSDSSSDSGGGSSCGGCGGGGGGD